MSADYHVSEDVSGREHGVPIGDRRSIVSCSDVNELNELSADNTHAFIFAAYKHPTSGTFWSHVSQRFGISGEVIAVRVY